jgi:heat shock protein HslJ
MHIRQILTTGLLALLLGGCASTSNSAPEASIASLANSKWLVTGLGKADKTVSPTTPSDKFTLDFDAAGRASGQSGCNRYSSAYTGAGNQIKFGLGISTRMMCVEPEDIMAQEALMLQALTTIATWRIENGGLVMRTAAGDIALTAKPLKSM